MNKYKSPANARIAPSRWRYVSRMKRTRCETPRVASAAAIGRRLASWGANATGAAGSASCDGTADCVQ